MEKKKRNPRRAESQEVETGGTGNCPLFSILPPLPLGYAVSLLMSDDLRVPSGGFGEGNGNPLSILAWKIPMDRGAWLGYSPWGCKESAMTE